MEAIRDPDRLPDSTDPSGPYRDHPSGPCPHCGRVSNFALIAQLPVTYDKSGVRYAGAPAGQERPVLTSVAVPQCHGCLDNTVVIQDGLVGGVRGGRSGQQTWEGIYWWPTPDVADLGLDVPASIVVPYEEGLRCLSANAPNGAATMFRTAMIYLVETRAQLRQRPRRISRIGSSRWSQTGRCILISASGSPMFGYLLPLPQCDPVVILGARAVAA